MTDSHFSLVLVKTKRPSCFCITLLCHAMQCTNTRRMHTCNVSEPAAALNNIKDGREFMFYSASSLQDRNGLHSRYQFPLFSLQTTSSPHQDCQIFPFSVRLSCPTILSCQMCCFRRPTFKGSRPFFLSFFFNLQNSHNNILLLLGGRGKVLKTGRETCVKFEGKGNFLVMPDTRWRAEGRLQSWEQSTTSTTFWWRPTLVLINRFQMDGISLTAPEEESWNEFKVAFFKADSTEEEANASRSYSKSGNEHFGRFPSLISCFPAVGGSREANFKSFFYQQ
jgi:hypothetical protein